MEHDESNDRARQLANALLRKPVKLVADQFEGIRTVGVEVRDALDRDRIPRLLLETIAVGMEVRRELFGDGDSPIDLEIRKLRRAIMLLSDTGLRDVEALRTGEELLERLIRGVRIDENEQIRGISAEAAGDEALRLKALKQLGENASRGQLEGIEGDDFQEMVDQMCERIRWEGNGSITPNELDDAQQSALLCYQQSRHCRIALEIVLAGLKAINEELDRDRPEHQGKSWTLGR